MIYVFDEYELDVSRMELRVAGRPRPIAPKPYALLSLLVENADRALSKDEIVERIWNGRFVSDTSISSCVKAVRKAVGDSGKTQRYVKTVSRQGFRFAGKVTLRSESRVDLPGSTAVDRVDRDATTIRNDLGQRPSLAILPLRTVPESDEHRQFADSMTYELILSVSRLRWITVISRGSTFRFRQPNVDSHQAGTMLGARYVLSGVVEFRGRTLTVGVELSECGSGVVVWANRFSGRRADVHEMRENIAARVLLSLELEIPLHESRRARLTAVENLDAWSAYHVGLQHLYRFNKRDNLVATGYFDRAVELDPQLARAYAGLSFVAFQNAFNRYTDDRKGEVDLALKFAERSIEIDPMDPFANFCMGRCFMLGNDLEKSIPWLDRAIDINPNYAHGYYARGLSGLMAGERMGSEKNARFATLLSPLDPYLFAFRSLRSLSCIERGDYIDALCWAEAGANAPGALAVMDLFALATATLAKDEAAERRWLRRVRGRRVDLDQAYFFRALPFKHGDMREKLSHALSKHGL